MSLKSLSTGILTTIIVSAGGSANAQDAFLGKSEFVQRCAVCHGEEGAGDGMVGELFATRLTSDCAGKWRNFSPGCRVRIH